jgi:hypothetical protein
MKRPRPIASCNAHVSMLGFADVFILVGFTAPSPKSQKSPFRRRVAQNAYRAKLNWQRSPYVPAEFFVSMDFESTFFDERNELLRFVFLSRPALFS